MPAKKRTSAPKKKASSNKSQILEVARKELGFESLRPGQEPAVRALLDGRDCLTIMPTGSGKSAIYQIAGCLLEGPVLVVSPLIALQKDQVDSINDQTDQQALVINSAQRASENREAIEQLEEGSGKFVFLAPEQLRKQETIQALQSAGISLFVVDEAHCISEWGHDFRPDYLQLGSVREALGNPVTLAMTATASPEVRAEIIERLRLKDPAIFIHGFDRPNISLRVDRFESEDDKLDALVHRVRWAEKPGIVYVATRKNAEAIMHQLKEEGVEALFYHGGLKASERTAIQEQFMAGDTERHRRNQCLRDGNRQVERALRLSLRRDGFTRFLLPGNRTRRPGWRKSRGRSFLPPGGSGRPEVQKRRGETGAGKDRTYSGGDRGSGGSRRAGRSRRAGQHVRTQAVHSHSSPGGRGRSRSAAVR